MNAPCPYCDLAGGFHDDRVHSRIVVPRNKIVEKGWQLTGEPKGVSSIATLRRMGFEVTVVDDPDADGVLEGPAAR